MLRFNLAMTQISIRSEPVPFNLELGTALRLGDEELFELCSRNPGLRIERTAGGDLIVMTPAGGESSRRNARVVAALVTWADRDGSGVVYDSSGGFLLGDGAMRSPDAAWVRKERIETLSREQRERFVPLCPDFVIELRSPSDALSDLQAKMEEYRSDGAALGWLIDPFGRQVSIYRAGHAVEVLDQPSSIDASPDLPGFVLELGSLWAESAGLA